MNGLWHLDFHHGSRAVLEADGRWLTPRLLGVIDDHRCRAPGTLAPLMAKLVAEFVASGVPPGFTPSPAPRAKGTPADNLGERG